MWETRFILYIDINKVKIDRIMLLVVTSYWHHMLFTSEYLTECQKKERFNVRCIGISIINSTSLGPIYNNFTRFLKRRNFVRKSSISMSLWINRNPVENKPQLRTLSVTEVIFLAKRTLQWWENLIASANAIENKPQLRHTFSNRSYIFGKAHITVMRISDCICYASSFFAYSLYNRLIIEGHFYTFFISNIQIIKCTKIFSLNKEKSVPHT